MAESQEQFQRDVLDQFAEMLKTHEIVSTETLYDTQVVYPGDIRNPSPYARRISTGLAVFKIGLKPKLKSVPIEPREVARRRNAAMKRPLQIPGWDLV